MKMYGAIEVTRLTGISYRMLNHLCDTGRVPGYVAPGSGMRREFTQEQFDAVSRWAKARRISKIAGTLPESVLDEIEALIMGLPVEVLDQAASQ